LPLAEAPRPSGKIFGTAILLSGYGDLCEKLAPADRIDDSIRL